MPKTKKKFIDKKHATTFHLVHRSQRDPLIADENAPQHVFVPANEPKKKAADLEEQQKYGIYFDDDYDYLQHLKILDSKNVEWVKVETGNKNVDVKKQAADKAEEEEEEVYRIEQPPKLVLPSSVFASEIEEEVGLLNRAAPQGLRLDLDPDIVAAMDEDFDFDDPDNVLDDDFVQLANAPRGSDEEAYDDDDDDDRTFGGRSDYGDEEADDVASLDDGQRSFMEEETKSRFTEYSMSSSVIRRNNQLTLLDDRFENMFSEYDDTKIGPLDQDSDDEDGVGFLEPNSDMVLKCVKDFDKAAAETKTDKDAEVDERVRRILENYESESDDDSFRELEVKSEGEDEKWDCQSILSTYSTTSNRPKLISEKKGSGKIRVSGRTGVPVGVLDANKLTAKTLAQFNEDQSAASGDELPQPQRPESIISMLSTLSVRPKDETPEERRARKKALKEYRRERVIERKANAAAFTEEKKRHEKVMMNNKNMRVIHV